MFNTTDGQSKGNVGKCGDRPRWLLLPHGEKLTDLSQLTKAILKGSPSPCHVEKPAPEPSQSREDADAAAVLAYFSRPSQNAPRRNRAAPVAKDESTKPTQLSPEASAEPRSGRYAGCILAAPGAVAEVFPGEVREQVVVTLLDGLGTAERSGRERRAEILRYVLAANQSSGELERRRAELRQILKDAGYYNDPKPLERLGLRLISGRTHWKLQYANVRVTMSKTPSDYRANLNNGNEIANRCF